MRYLVSQTFDTLGSSELAVFHDQVEAEACAAELREDIGNMIREAYEVERPYAHFEMLSTEERRAWDVAQELCRGSLWFTREAAKYVADQAVRVEIEEE